MKFTGSLRLFTISFGIETDMMILPTEELTLLGGYKLVLRNTANATDWKAVSSGGRVTDPVVFTFSLDIVLLIVPIPIMS